MTITLTFAPTGEARCPGQGEWFLNGSGWPTYAEMAFSFATFPILRLVCKEEDQHG